MFTQIYDRPENSTIWWQVRLSRTLVKTSSVTGSPYNSCGPICLNKACSNLTLCDFLSDERSLLIPPYLTIFPTPPPLPPPLLTRPFRSYYMDVLGGVGGRGGGVGKIVKYGGMSNDRSSDKKSHKVRFEQALFKQIGPQLLYGFPVVQF